MSGVIVLNTDNTALHTVSVQHAIRMLIREVAIVEEAHEDRTFGPFPWPRVLRLVRYVKTAFQYARSPAWSKRGVLRRDGHRCAYCQGTRRHRRPPAAPVARRAQLVAEHGGRLHPVQSPQGQPDPDRGRHAAGLKPGSRPGGKLAGLTGADRRPSSRAQTRRSGEPSAKVVGRSAPAVEGQTEPQRHLVLDRLQPDRDLRAGAAAFSTDPAGRQPLSAGRSRRLAGLGGDHRRAGRDRVRAGGRWVCCSASSARSSSIRCSGGPANSGDAA